MCPYPPRSFVHNAWLTGSGRLALVIWLVADQANRKVSLQRLYWLIGSLTQPISRYVKCLEMPPRNLQQDTTIRISSLNNIQLASQSKGLRDQKSWACSKIRTFQMHRLPVWSSQRIHFWNCSREEPIKKSPMVGNGPFTGPLVKSTVKIHCWSLSWVKPCALSLFYYFFVVIAVFDVQSQKNLVQERPCISPSCEISKSWSMVARTPLLHVPIWSWYSKPSTSHGTQLIFMLVTPRLVTHIQDSWWGNGH